MKNRRNAFTLVELLVVIAIIALLLSILLPALNKAREMAYRVKCSANLSALGKALNFYKHQNDGAIPMVARKGLAGDPAGYGANWGTLSRTDVYTGLNRDETDPLTVADFDRCITALPWLLVRGGNRAGLFVCPSDQDVSAEREQDLKYEDLQTKAEEYYWDFTSDKTISYSYQAVKQGQWIGRITNWSAELIIMADKTPAYSGLEKEGTRWRDVKTDAQKRANMSQNHAQGEAINVLAWNGEVKTEERSDVNPLIGKDNIYTWADRNNYGMADNAENYDAAQQQGRWGIVIDSFVHGPYQKK